MLYFIRVVAHAAKHHPATAVHLFAVNRIGEQISKSSSFKAGFSHGYSGSLGFVFCRGGFGVKFLIVRTSLVVLRIFVSHHKIHVDLEFIAPELAVVIASISCLWCVIYSMSVVCGKKGTYFRRALEAHDSLPSSEAAHATKSAEHTRKE